MQTLHADKATGVPCCHGEFSTETKGNVAGASPVRDNLSEIEDAMLGALAMTVLIFVSITAPFRPYAPDITRLQRRFSPRGVRFG